MSATFFSDLLPASRILTKDEDCIFYGHDWCKELSGKAAAVLLPETTEEVQKIVVRAGEKKIALVPSGGRTGLSGGANATNGEVVLSFERMRKIISWSPVERLITVQAGCSIEQINTFLKEHGLFFPVEFTTKGSSQIGGNIATNAGGIRVVKYGNIRESIIGLTAVTGTGAILSPPNRLFKSNCGYDLKSLLIGSEGTLGIITEATLKIVPLPRSRARLLCGTNSLQKILDLFQKTRTEFSQALSCFEYFTHSALEKVLLATQKRAPLATPTPHYALIELENTALDQYAPFFLALHESGEISDICVAENDKQSAELLEYRERIGEVLSQQYHPHKNDISVPIESIPDFLTALEKLFSTTYQGVCCEVFGHIGDGNLHINVLKPATRTASEFKKDCATYDFDLFSLIQKFRGSISAEHGVGIIKKEYMKFTRSAEEIELMRAIKKQFDPLQILNPGKTV